MAKKIVFEIYVELLQGEDFTATTESNKRSAFATAQDYLKNGYVNDDPDTKRVIFIPVHEIKRVIVQERSIDVGE